MTSIYRQAGPQYFHETSYVYGPSTMSFKQEPMDEAEPERPVDMSLQTREPPPIVPHHKNLVSQPMNVEESQYYSSYIHPHHHNYHSHHLPPAQGLVSKRISTVRNPSVESCISSIPPSSPSTDAEDFAVKGSDGKLTIPAILNNNSRVAPIRSVDLLPLSTHQRAKREFVPDNKKDEGYWCKRLKNNDSARRSRVKRKALEKMMETRLMELQKENIELKHEMAALKRRFGMEEGSTSDSSLRSQPRSSSPTLSESPSGQNEDKLSQDEDLEQQSAGSDDSRSNDDSRVYSMGSVTALNCALGPAGRDRTDSMGSSASSLTSGPNSVPPEMLRNSQSDLALRTDKTGALDLTSDHSNRSTPARDSSSPESFSSNNRRSSVMSSDSSSQEETSGKTFKAFPLKCRWKKEMHAAQSSISEEKC